MVGSRGGVLVRGEPNCRGEASAGLGRDDTGGGARSCGLRDGAAAHTRQHIRASVKIYHIWEVLEYFYEYLFV